MRQMAPRNRTAPSLCRSIIRCLGASLSVVTCGCGGSNPPASAIASVAESRKSSESTSLDSRAATSPLTNSNASTIALPASETPKNADPQLRALWNEIQRDLQGADRSYFQHEFVGARSGYLAAWEKLHPNPLALVMAAHAAHRQGDSPAAAELLERARREASLAPSTVACERDETGRFVLIRDAVDGSIRCSVPHLVHHADFNAEYHGILSFSADHSLLASGSDVKAEGVQVWDTAECTRLSRLPSPPDFEVHGLAFSPDATLLLVAS